MIDWKCYPVNVRIPESLMNIVEVFEKHESQITSSGEKVLKSNEVLSEITLSLEKCGYLVETSKAAKDKIRVPVTYKERGRPDLTFEADAYHTEDRVVLEVEAGRAVTNNQFLKDLFQACMMENVEYFCVAVRKIYRGNRDYEKVVQFFDALYVSNRIKLPLKGILVIGY